MGVMRMIAKAKGQFHKRRIQVMEGRTAKLQEANLKEAEITKAKAELREAKQIRADLRADQMKKVEGQQPSKLRKLGQGMAAHMNKQRQSSRPLDVGGTSGKGSPFGGQRNLNVGGDNGGAFSFGPTPKAQPKKKKQGTTIIIRQ